MKPAGPIVITGFMGCGKTEAARALARRLNLTLVDLDEEIAEREGRTAAQLIDERGEPAFRAIETNTLRQLLQAGAAGVIALGGGAWITEEIRKLVSQHDGLTVWLDTPFDLCWQRIESSAEERPLGRTREQAEQLYRIRQPVYRLAQVHVEVMVQDDLESLVDRIEDYLAHYLSSN